MDFATAKLIASHACKALGHKVTGEVSSYPLVRDPSSFGIKCQHNCGLRICLRRFDNGTWDVSFVPQHHNRRVITLLDYNDYPEMLKDEQYQVCYCIRIRALM